MFYNNVPFEMLNFIVCFSASLGDMYAISSADLLYNLITLSTISFLCKSGDLYCKKIKLFYLFSLPAVYLPSACR